MRYTQLLLMAIIISIVSLQPLKATTYLVNLNEPGGVPGTGGSLTYNPGCYCGEGLTEIYSPLYHFASGSIVDFGNLDIFTADIGQSTPDGGPNQPNLYINGSFAVSYSSTPAFPAPSYPGDFIYFLCDVGDTSCNSSAKNYVALYDLVFTIPAGSDSVQIKWDAIDFSYAPAVSEPPTWATAGRVRGDWLHRISALSGT
jgi:hypothetical protein